MKVITDISNFNEESPIFLTQGTFDGVHLGHQKILKKLVSEAQNANGKSVLLTFNPHPRLVLYPDDNSLKLIQTLDEKIDAIRAIGLDYMIILPFTVELSRTKADIFTRDVLVNKLNISKLIIGYDHRFGKNREGTLEQMKEFAKIYDFEIEEIPAQDIEESIISSTKIRKALDAGRVDEACMLLGREFHLTGFVIKGDGRGKALGFPTANLDIKNEVKLIPMNGVYAVKVEIDHEKYSGMLNIGHNPTFPNADKRIEVHIFDFNKQIYNHEIKLHFVEKTRDERKFDSPEQLIQQLKNDEIRVRQILDN